MIAFDLPGTWNALNRLHRLRAISNEDQYDDARRIVARLAVRDDLRPDQAEYLETLTVLMEAYEQQMYPITKLGGIAALQALMKQHEMSASDLGRLLGNRALGAKVLRGERELSKSHMMILGAHFKVSPALFFPLPAGGRTPKQKNRAAKPLRRQRLRAIVRSAR